MWKAGMPIADASNSSTVVDASDGHVSVADGTISGTDAADEASSAEPNNAGRAVVGNARVPFDRPERNAT